LEQVDTGIDGYTSLLPDMENIRFSESLNSSIDLSCSNLGIKVNQTTSRYNPTFDAEFPDLHTINSIRVASEEMGALRQDLRVNTAIGRLVTDKRARDSDVAVFRESKIHNE